MLRTDTPTPILKKILAWSVHLLTASGAVWGFLALIAINRGDLRLMMIWVVVSIVVDSVDGTLARALGTREHAAALDGALLDNILDYFTYVIVPAYALYSTDLLPPAWRLAGALSILLTSAYQFSQSDAKTDDHYFKGFPSYWNVVVVYMLVLAIPPVVNLAILAILNVLIFVPIKYIYPSRTRRGRRLTLTLTILYGVVLTAAMLMYPNTPRWLVWVSLLYIAYYLVMSLLQARKDKGQSAA